MAAEQSWNKVLSSLSNNRTVGGVRVLGRGAVCRIAFIVLMATVTKFKVGELALALRADAFIGFRLVSTQPYLDQISQVRIHKRGSAPTEIGAH
jgi:hypothetical protein